MAFLGLSVTEILILSTGVLTALYFYTTRNFDYFTKRGIKGPKPYPLIGTLYDFFRKDMMDVQKERYKAFPAVYGTFEKSDPVYVVSDPLILRSILQKDFHHFEDRRTFKHLDELFPTFSRSLTNLEGEEWKQLRSVVSPTFTTGKIKNMMFAMSTACEEFLENFKGFARSEEPIDTKKIFDGYTMNVVASCGFGIQVDSLKNPNHPFVVNARTLGQTFRKNWVLVVLMFFGRILTYLPFNIIDPKMIEFFDNTLDNLMHSKSENTEEYKKRTDFLQLLLEARKKEDVEKCDDEEIADPDYFKQNKKLSAKKILDDLTVKSQAFQLFFAGYETTAATLSYTAYCLATNPEVQDRLCAELDEKLGKEKIVYESLSESNLPYLDAVINESLRMYPAAPALERKCTKDYQYENVQLKKGMLVQIPTLAMHHDENFYPEPEKFLPERFLPENRSSIQPLTFLPFGAGPRNCVGMRFALFEVKIVIATLLREIKFKTNPDTDKPPLSHSMGRLYSKPLSLSVELRHK